MISPGESVCASLSDTDVHGGILVDNSNNLFRFQEVKAMENRDCGVCVHIKMK